MSETLPGAIRTYKNASAIVTGGASGIGRALSEQLASRGAEVVVADLQGELAEEVAADIRERGGTAEATTLDVTDCGAVVSLCQKVTEKRGRLDYVFNNAGIAVGGAAELHSIEDWNRVLDVNVRGVVNGVFAAYGIMLKQGFGHLVNTASIAGLCPFPGGTSYAASKHAVVGLSKSLRSEAASRGVRVSVICPGVVRTPILESGGRHGKLLIEVPPEDLRRAAEKLRPIRADVFASRVLRHVARNRAIIIVPGWWRICWWLERLWPPGGMSFAGSLFERMRRQYGG